MQASDVFVLLDIVQFKKNEFQNKIKTTQGWPVDHCSRTISYSSLGIYLVSLWIGIEGLVLKNDRGVDAIFTILHSSIVFVLIASFILFVQIHTPSRGEGCEEVISLYKTGVSDSFSP